MAKKKTLLRDFALNEEVGYNDSYGVKKLCKQKYVDVPLRLVWGG
jgi:hypothetical protein